MTPCKTALVPRVHSVYCSLLITTLFLYSFMLVGGPNAGKTSVLKVLAATLCLLKERNFGDEEAVIYSTVNPKSITMGQLFGEFDPVTHEVWL